MVFLGWGYVATGGAGFSVSSGIVFEVTIAATPRTATVVNKMISDVDSVIKM